MSVLLDRFKLARYLGSMFGGKRNLYTVFGYENLVTYEHLYAKYHRQDITARVIDAPANALWDNPPEIVIEGLENFDQLWKKLVKRHDLWQILSRADKMAGMGDFSLILCGLTQAGSNLKNPVTPNVERDVLYLQPYAYDSLQLQEIEDDAASPNYMKPKLYQIQPYKEINTGKIRKVPATFQVHASRTIHIVESPLVNDVYGNPRGVKIYNLLDDLLKIVGGTAETFWLTANRGMQINVDKEMDLTREDAQDLSDEIDEYFHELRRYIRTRGVDIKSLGSDVPNPKNVFEMLIALISGATGIPKRILIGSEAGQLASEQDRSNWAERIQERRTSFGNPTLMNLLLTLRDAGVLPFFEAEQVDIMWPDAFKLSPLEMSNTANQRARSAVNLSKALESPSEFLSRNEARGIIGLPEREEAGLDDLESVKEETPDERLPEDNPQPPTEPDER